MKLETIPLPTFATDPKTGKLVFYFDASLMSGSGGCDLKAILDGVYGFRNTHDNCDIVFGSALHVFKAEMLHSNGANMADAFWKARQCWEETPKIMKKRKDHLCTTLLVKICMLYWSQVGSQTDFTCLRDPRNPDRAMAELTFEIPVYEDDRIIVRVCGTIDEIGKWPFGAYGISDLKSTHVYEGGSYLEEFEMTIQLKLYLWAIHKLAERYEFYAHMASKQLGAFIDGIFINPSSDPQFKRSEIFFYSAEQVAEVDRLITGFAGNYAKHIHQLLDSGELPERTGILFGACKSKYGSSNPCKYFKACIAKSVVHREGILRTFTTSIYDPKNFRTYDNEKTKDGSSQSSSSPTTV